MQFADVVAKRRMVRSFETRPVPSDVLDRVLDLARRVPAAGNTQSLDLVVLEGEQTQRYWEASLPMERRVAFPWPKLLDAPVLIIPVSWPAAYVERPSSRLPAAPAAATAPHRDCPGPPQPLSPTPPSTPAARKTLLTNHCGTPGTDQSHS